MSEEEENNAGQPPKQQKSLPDRMLVDGWRKFWKTASFWAFVLIGAAPDIYAGISAMGWLDDQGVPQTFVWSLRSMAALGIVVRFVRQGKCEPTP